MLHFDQCRLRQACAAWSEALLVTHTTLLEISCRGSIQFYLEIIALTPRYVQHYPSILYQTRPLVHTGLDAIGFLIEKFLSLTLNIMG